MDDARILEILRGDLDVAQKGRIGAIKAFHEALEQIASGIPQTDGLLRIRSAGREYSRTLQTVTRAMHRLTDYMVSGAIPPDDERFEEIRRRRLQDLGDGPEDA